MPEFVLVSPAFPPARGGVADHSWRFAEELAALGAVTVFTSRGAENGPKFRVLPEVSSWSDVSKWLPRLLEIANGRSVVWQYVPHLYGRGGANPALGRAFEKLARHGIRQLLMAHEIAAPWSPWPHRCLYAWSHRRQWHAILQHVDSIGISTEQWLLYWQRKCPGTAERMWLAPSPSTIPVVALTETERAQWRQQFNLPPNIPVLGFFGDASAPKRLAWVIEAWKQSATQKNRAALMMIGAGFNVQQIRAVADRGLLRELGYLPPAKASAALQVVDLLLLPFVDGISERRTSLMAGISHGRAVVATRGSNTGPSLQQAQFVEIVEAGDFCGFCHRVDELLRDPARRAALGAAGHSAYHRQFDWPVLMERFKSQLAARARPALR